MSVGDFVIAEQRRVNGNALEDTGVEFRWNNKTQSSPRDGWQFGLKQRSKRTDYPGSNIPTEQVLGGVFTPFTVKGMWDDRYAGVGFAEDTRVAMEEMVSRGGLVHITFQALSIYGLITEFDVDYRQQFRQGYSITVSPHFRNPDADPGRQSSQAPKAVYNATDYTDQALASARALLAAHDGAPSIHLKADLVTRVFGALSSVQGAVDTAAGVVTSRVLAVSTTAESARSSVARLAQSFVTMKDQARNVLNALGHNTPKAIAAAPPATPKAQLPIRSDVNLDFEDTISVLAFETWARTLGALARRLIVQAEAARIDLASRVQPDVRVLYRPMAGESLYNISNRFYGTPFKWRSIAERNGLYGFALQGTELLIIPERAA